MNAKVLNDIISFYKENYEQIKNREIYKWEMVEHFHRHWDLYASDFKSMLSNSMAKTKNILATQHYQPKDNILIMAKHNPDFTRELFKDLYNEEKDLKERIAVFQSKTKQFVKDNSELFNNKSLQYHDAIMTYLTLRYPETYYFYKYGYFKWFADKVEFELKPKRGSIDNITFYMTLCEQIHEKVINDSSLISMNTSRHALHPIDHNYHLLTQDIIYSIKYYMNIAKLDNDDYIRIDSDEYEKNLDNLSVSSFSAEPVEKTIKKSKETGTKPDYEAIQSRNKRIGDAGEEFVLKYEKSRVNKFRNDFESIVQWKAKTEGDGLGYDILSINEDGSKRYIEVKTTRGQELDAFYITQRELEKSNEEKGNYYLYRVHHFDVDTGIGSISIHNGSLKKYCLNPVNYLVVFNKTK